MLRVPSILMSPTTPRRTPLLGTFVAAVPAVAFAWSGVIAAPAYFDPMFARHPELMGVPISLIISIFAVAWGAIGGYVVGTSSSPWVRLAAVVVFTLPACAALILGPALILILQNLG